MATVAEPAGPLTDQATLKDSAFIKAQRYAAKDTDVTRDVDVSAAAENEESGLDQVMSGPMLTRPTVDGEDSDLADVLDVPFSEICHSGLAWNWKNCLIKIWRYTIVPIKEVYLPLMTWGLPTNFLMVSSCSTCPAAVTRYLMQQQKKSTAAHPAAALAMACGSAPAVLSARLLGTVK